MERVELNAVIERTRALVRDVVLPVDGEHDGDIERTGGDVVRVTLQDAARAAGVPGATPTCRWRERWRSRRTRR